MTHSPTKMSIVIASPPDRKKLVAEIFYNHEQWAEISQESADLALELYPRRDGMPWQFSFDEALAALEHAKRRLVADDTSETRRPLA